MIHADGASLAEQLAENAAAQGGSAAVETVTAVAVSGKTQDLGSEIAKNEHPEPTAAKIVVSGGRAMGSPLGRVRGSDEAREGLEAFVEKRPAVCALTRST